MRLRYKTECRLKVNWARFYKRKTSFKKRQEIVEAKETWKMLVGPLLEVTSLGRLGLGLRFSYLMRVLRVFFDVWEVMEAFMDVIYFIKFT